MRSLFLAVVVCLGALACTQQPPAPAAPAPPEKVAEGAYGDFNTWTLFLFRDGGQVEADIDISVYTEVVRREKSQSIVQKETLRMDPDFTMRGFRYESKNFSGLSDGALDCTVNEKSLDCVSTFEGRDRGKGKIDVAGAYATQFGVHIALLDLPWFYTTLVAHSDRDRSNPMPIGIVTIAFDGDTPDTLVTGSGVAAKVNYIGPETLRMFGRNVTAQKFHITAHTYEATVWTAHSGLLLRADWADMHMELTRYKQWAPIVPELPVEEQPKPKQ